jgi:hypothetical protein
MSLRDEDLALLADRWLDGGLTQDERQRLAGDPQLARRFIAELRFQGRVGGLLRQDGRELLDHVEDALALGSSTGLADRVLARLRPPAQRQWWRWAAGAALAAGLLVAVLLAAGGTAGPVRAGPSEVTAAVEDEAHPAVAPVALEFGSLLAVDLDQEARVAFKDGTRLQLGAASSVRLARNDPAGTRIALESGSLSAEVARQPQGTHFQVATRDALLTVIGTRFIATRMPWGTRVEVAEGRVRTTRASDGRELEVGAGNRVDVGPGVMALTAIRPLLPAGARVFEPSADAVVVGGRFAHGHRGKRTIHQVTSPQARPDEQREFYVAFDLARVTAPPAHAELRLHLTLLRRLGMRLHLARVDQPWQETAITWSERPPHGAEVALWSPDQEDAAIDLTAAVRAAVGTQLSLCLYADAGEAPDAIVGFHTREAAPPLRPQLVLEY